MLFRTILAVGLMTTCAQALCASEPESTATLESLRASYQNSLKAIVDASIPPELLKQYGESVNAVMASCQKNGDLDGLVAARNEKQRFEQERTVPEESPDDLAPAVLKARQDFRKALTRNEIDRNRKVLGLADKYAASLDSLKKQLTQQGKIDAAMAAKAESDRVRTSAEVTAAQFALADEVVSKPPPVAGNPQTEPRADVPKERVSSARAKIIPCKGGATADWTRTSFDIKKGDVVTLKAKGFWYLVNKDGSCGPEGYEEVFEWVFVPSGKGNFGTSVKRRIEYNRQTPSQRYGALLCRIGTGGELRAVGSSTSFTASEEGALFLDANVRTGKENRKGCSGDLSVDIEIKRMQ